MKKLNRLRQFLEMGKIFVVPGNVGVTQSYGALGKDKKGLYLIAEDKIGRIDLKPGDVIQRYFDREIEYAIA